MMYKCGQTNHGFFPEISEHLGNLVLVHVVQLRADFLFGVNNVFLEQILRDRVR